MEEDLYKEENSEVLIEKSGKFELVNSLDVQAMELDTDTVSTEPSLPPLDVIEPKKSVEENANGSNLATETEKRTEPAASAVKPAANSVEAVANTVEPKASTVEEVASTVEPSEEVEAVIEPTSTLGPADTELKTSSKVRIAETIKPEKPCSKANLSSSSFTAYHKPRGKTHWRTMSAPGSRSQLTVNSEEKQKLNDAAFSAWVQKKNSELARKLKKQRQLLLTSMNEKEERRQHNEIAFNAWCAEKEKLLKEQRDKEKLSRPVTCNNYEQRNTEAFEDWLRRKHETKKKELEFEQRRVKEQETAAKKYSCDPVTIQKAYKK